MQTIQIITAIVAFLGYIIAFNICRRHLEDSEDAAHKAKAFHEDNYL